MVTRVFHVPGTDIKLFHAADGKSVGAVDTSQLQNHMAALSPDGRFLAAAAFTADVKVSHTLGGQCVRPWKLCNRVNLSLSKPLLLNN